MHCCWVLHRPLERSPCFSLATDDEKRKDGVRGEKKLWRGGEAAVTAVCRRFRILDHRHGDQSPGNRVHNGSGRRGNSVVSGSGGGGGRVVLAGSLGGR